MGVETVVLERTMIFGVETMVLNGFVVLLRTSVIGVGSGTAPISKLTTSINNICNYRIIIKKFSIDFASIFLHYHCKLIILNISL